MFRTPSCIVLTLLVVVLLGTTASTGLADIWAAHIFDDMVQRLDDETGAVLSGGITSGSAGLVDPAGITIGPDGNIYVSSQGTGEILFYDRVSGAPLASPHPGGRAGLFATLPLNGMSPAAPSRLSFGPDGNLYVADFNGPNVRLFDGLTGVLDPTPAATVGINVGGIVFGSDGALYVGDFSAGNVVRVLGGMQEEFIPAGSGPAGSPGLANPGGLTFLPDGDLLIADLFNNQILRFDENGDNPELFAEIPPPIPEELPPGAFFSSNFPSEMILDPDGNLIIGVLGLTNPDFGGDDRGALLRCDLDCSSTPATIISGLPPVSDLIWLPSPDAVPGDYDGNLLVEEADFTEWRADFGKTVAPFGGSDGNGDGFVDGADYTVWRDEFDGGAGVGSVAVPEPSAAMLIALGGLLLMTARVRLRPQE